MLQGKGSAIISPLLQVVLHVAVGEDEGVEEAADATSESVEILVVIDRLTVAQADQAEAQQGQGTSAEHLSAHLMCQAILGGGCMVVDILVEASC